MKRIMSIMIVLLMTMNMVGCTTSSSINNKGKYTDEEISRYSKKVTHVKNNTYNMYVKKTSDSNLKRIAYVIIEDGNEYNSEVQLLAKCDVDTGEITSIRIKDVNNDDYYGNLYTYKLSGGQLTDNQLLKDDYNKIKDKYSDKEFISILTYYYWTTECK